MKVTLVALFLTLVGCGQAEDGTMPAAAPDSGAVMATGGTGGTGPEPATTGGTGGTASAGGTGGMQAGGPDAGAPKASPDAQPAGEPPKACMVERLHSFVCTSPANSASGRVLRKDGYACNQCVTSKSDGTVDKYYAGCIPAPGAICVMDCNECK